MPQLEKTLTYKRGRWETTVKDVKTILIVYEQHAEKKFVRPDEPPEWMKAWDEDYTPTWFNIYARAYCQPQPHYSLSITLVVSGDEIRLCAMTAGSGQEQCFIADSGSEYSLFEALDITLNNLDKIIL